MTDKTMRLPKLRASASFEPATMNEEQRTVELLWYSGASVMRHPFFGDSYELAFSMEPQAVRLDRLKGGANLLASHNDQSLHAVLGVVENARIEGGQGFATVRFSARDEVEPIWQDVKSGILRHVSMAAVVHELKEVTEKGARVKKFLAIDWEPHEVSIVSIPADPKAGVLSHQSLSGAAELFDCTVTMLSAEGGAHPEGVRMDPNTPTPATTPGNAPGSVVDLAAVRSEAARLERERIAEINRIVAAAKLGAEVAHKLVADGATLDAARKHVIDQLAAQDEADPGPSIGGRPTVLRDHEAQPEIMARLADALLARVQNKPAPDSAREFEGASLAELAAETLKARRVRFSPRNKVEIVKLALSTSDYPNLLAAVANKILLPQYAAADPTYRRFCIQRNAPDFKTINFLRAGDFPAPLQVGEGGEIKLGYFAESKNTAALLTYGRRIAVTRQMIINDDLSSLQQVMGAYGARIASFENTAFFTLLSTVGPTLGDGAAMFNATALTTAAGHANYTSSGTAISDTSLTVGIELMKRQTGLGADNLGDGIPLNIMPRFLLHPIGKTQLAHQYTSAAFVPAAPTSQNPWAGKLEPISDANLAAGSTRWWLFADPAQAGGANFAYGSLEGAPGPRVETRNVFETEGTELKVAFDFYVAGIDWRFGYCNAGA
jgi:hypothetical protein